MVGKSIDYYGFLGATGLSVTFESSTLLGRGEKTKTLSYDAAFPVQTASVEITETDIKLVDHYGKFEWHAYQDRAGQAHLVGSAFWNIAPLTGAMDSGAKGSPTVMLATPSTFSQASNWALSYGFYDSGSGIGNDLTNHDQSYVYLTEDVSGWMGKLVAAHPSTGTLPLSSFVLPGAHDAGTYDVKAIEALITEPVFQDMIAQAWSDRKPGQANLPVISLLLQRLVIQSACTQKDDVTGMLNMGIRYFDFRPGYCYGGLLPGAIYHQHNFIPGALLLDFMTDLIAWLAAHPNEIVVVSLNFQGFADPHKMCPSVKDLDKVVSQASNRAAHVGQGNLYDLKKTYNDLVKSGTRLIFLNQTDPDAEKNSINNVVKYDSYDPALYQTTDVSNVLTALNATTKAKQAGLEIHRAAASGHGQCGDHELCRHRDESQRLRLAAHVDQGDVRYADLSLAAGEFAQSAGPGRPRRLPQRLRRQRPDHHRGTDHAQDKSGRGIASEAADGIWLSSPPSGCPRISCGSPS